MSACVVPTVKHGGDVMVWGALLVTLLDLLEFKAHLTSMAYAIPSGVHLVGLSFGFQQDNDPTHLQAV